MPNMAEGNDSNMEQPTSDASTADISHPDTYTAGTTTTYNNHNGDDGGNSAKGKKNSKSKSQARQSRASLINIQVILLDEEEFNCQVDVCI